MIFFVCIGAVSCYKTIEVDLPETEIKPVVNCLFTPDEPFVVNVSLTKAPNDTNSYFIKNADVIISGEGISEKTLPHAGVGFYSIKDFYPERGIEYSISVIIPGYEKLIASDKIPNSLTRFQSTNSASGFITKPVEGTGEEGKIPVQIIKCNIINDWGYSDHLGVAAIKNSLIHNYINGEITIIEDKNNYTSSGLGSFDPVITTEGLDQYYPPLLLFKDDYFKNVNVDVNFYFEKEVNSKFWLRFFNFSPEAYNYIKSWIIHEYTQDYDFWEVYEPLPLYSNIENGYGIFAGYSSELYEIYPDSTLIYNEH